MDAGTTRPQRPTALSFDDVVALVREQSDARVVGGGATVTGITLDSRRVLPGDVYAALPGARAHGIDFVDQAAAAGASMVLTDESGAAAVPPGLPAVVVAAAARGARRRVGRHLRRSRRGRCG